MGFVKKGLNALTRPISGILGTGDSGEAAARAQQEAYERQLQLEMNRAQLEASNAADETADVIAGGTAAENDKSIANVKRKKIRDSISNSLGIVA